MAIPTQAKEGKERAWNSADGRFTVDAVLVDYSDENVRLLKADGKTVSVPLKRISDADIEFLSSSKSNRYRVPGYFSIANVEAGGLWKEVARVQQNGRESVTVSTGSEELRRVGVTANLVIVPLAKAPTQEEQLVIAKGIAAKSFQEAGASLGANFHGVSGKVEEAGSRDERVYTCSSEYERATGGVIYQHVEIRFADDECCVLSFLSINKNVAKKYRRVGRSFTFERRSDKKNT